MRILSSVVYRFPFIVWSFLKAQTNTHQMARKSEVTSCDRTQLSGPLTFPCLPVRIRHTWCRTNCSADCSVPQKPSHFYDFEKNCPNAYLGRDDPAKAAQPQPCHHPQVGQGTILQPQGRQTRWHRLMKSKTPPFIAKALGSIPNRLQLAGGWIDQPFVSRHNPKPPGSMVVVHIEPDFRPMDRSGIAGGTRAIAMRIWKDKLPNRPPEDLVRELYEVENKGKTEPSGSQDMIGLVYPGVNRLDYDFKVHGGVFPSHIESCNSRQGCALAGQGVASDSSRAAARRLQSARHKKSRSEMGRTPRPVGSEIATSAIVKMDAKALGASLNLNMKCWETLLPHVVRHPLHPAGFDAAAQGVSTAIPWRDVFRLWWRLSDCRLERAGSRRVAR